MAAKGLGTGETYIFVVLVPISTSTPPLGISKFQIRIPGAISAQIFFLVSSHVMGCYFLKRKGKFLTPNRYGPTSKIIQQVHKYHQSSCSLLFLKKHTRDIEIRITAPTLRWIIIKLASAGQWCPPPIRSQESAFQPCQKLSSQCAVALGTKSAVLEFCLEPSKPHSRYGTVFPRK